MEVVQKMMGRRRKTTDGNPSVAAVIEFYLIPR
jgi:hypothetical protein